MQIIKSIMYIYQNHGIDHVIFKNVKSEKFRVNSKISTTEIFAFTFHFSRFRKLDDRYPAVYIQDFISNTHNFQLFMFSAQSF